MKKEKRMSFELAKWRLILNSPAPGAWNMAVDEAILQSVIKGECQPSLRFYAWSPPCLSLGYAQPIAEVDLAGLGSLGWDLVRRPTGGRAILHTDELTYSVIGPESDPRLSGGVLESYRKLSAALLVGLRLLGIDAKSVESVPGQNPPGDYEQAKSSNAKSKNPVCFEVPSNYEITYEGKKIIGSAQARRKTGVLQHGSFPLCGDLKRILNGLRFADYKERQMASERLLSRATTAEEAVGTTISWEHAAGAMVQAFKETLNLELKPDELTPYEKERANQLVKEKFAELDWTARV
jgi:lipoate-protein ligase A